MITTRDALDTIRHCDKTCERQKVLLPGHTQRVDEPSSGKHRQLVSSCEAALRLRPHFRGQENVPNAAKKCGVECSYGYKIVEVCESVQAVRLW